MRRDPVIGAMEIGEERAVPGLTDLGNVCLHIARYNFALLYCDKKKVVDAACGSGYGSSILSLVAAHVTGIDISESAISYANTRFSLANGEYKLGDLSDMKEEADVIVSFETTEHLPDLQKWEGDVYIFGPAQ